MQNFPFDEQNCTLKFSSWAYASDKLALEFEDKNDNMTMSLGWYTENSEWDIIAKNARRSRIENMPGSMDWYDLTLLHSMTILRCQSLKI
jgi:Neurotransmitter-gated ion-channel ligand binding domain